MGEQKMIHLVVLAHLLTGLAVSVSFKAIQMAISHSNGDYAQYMLERQNNMWKHEP